MLVGTFFLDKSHATHRWIHFGPMGIQPSELAKLAVILYLAWFLDLKRRSNAAMEFSKEDFLQTILPAVGPVLICRAADFAAAGSGHVGGHCARCHGHSFCRGTFVEVDRRRDSQRHLPVLYLLIIARFLSQRAADGLSQSRFRSARRGLSIDAIADRRRLRRIHRRRLDGEQTKTFLSARSAHRFHLRGDLRRARLHRRDSRDCSILALRRGAACAPRSPRRTDSAACSHSASPRWCSARR